MTQNGNMNNSTTGKNKISTQTITLIGLMAAFISVVAPWSIPLPFSPVPISFTNLAVYFTVYILGTKKATISYCIYLLLGLVGLPVFSNFSSGAGKLLGPTGGYLIGFIFMAVICGIFIERWEDKRVLHFIGMVLGTAVCYLFGTLWLAKQGNMNFSAALGAGVLPFLPGDFVKIVIALVGGHMLRSRLKRAKLI